MFEKIKNFLTKESTVSFLKNVAKTAIIMGAVGALFAATWPWIAPLAGMEVAFSWAKVAEIGMYFGLFGGLQAVVTPVVTKFFDPPKPGTTLLLAQTSSLEQGASIASQAPSFAHNVSPSHFQDMLAKQATASINPAGPTPG